MSATMGISLGADLTAEQAEEIFNQGKEAVIFALLELKLAEQQSPAKTTPSTPSGMVPPYEKPSAKAGGKRKPGRKKGHPGTRRSIPVDTDWKDTQARRLIRRFRRHQHDLFTFLDQPGVPFDNNHAERAIRPAVIIRKKQLRQSKRTRSGLPSSPHEYLPNTKATWPRSDPNHH